MNCLNGEMFKCPSPRMAGAKLTREACGKKWEIANIADRKPKCWNPQAANYLKQSAKHGPCRGCETGRSNSHQGINVASTDCILQIEMEYTTDKPPIKPKRPKAHKVCCDCGVKLDSPYHKTKRCKPCAKKANYARSRRWYAEQHPNARSKEDHIAMPLGMRERKEKC